VVGKKRYDRRVMNKQTLHRAFSSVEINRYPTIAKFLPSIFNPQVVFSESEHQVPEHQSPENQSLENQVPENQSPENQAPNENNDEDDLIMLDQLITNTLANRDYHSSVNQMLSSPQVPQASARAKEILVDSTQTDVEAATKEVVEQAETTVEMTANPELSKLSQELQEVSKESKEQREQTLIAEKQREIDHLAQTIKAPVAVSNKPVVVLPITAKSTEEAKFKSTKYSVKWLLEWCKKIAKIFSGAVVCKEEVEDL
jgi:hypothetical protein